MTKDDRYIIRGFRISLYELCILGLLDGCGFPLENRWHHSYRKEQPTCFSSIGKQSIYLFLGLSESEDIHRRMKVLCSEGRIPGTIQVGLFWTITKDAPKPADARIKSEKHIKGVGTLKYSNYNHLVKVPDEQSWILYNFYIMFSTSSKIFNDLKEWLI